MLASVDRMILLVCYDVGYKIDDIACVAVHWCTQCDLRTSWSTSSSTRLPRSTQRYPVSKRKKNVSSKAYSLIFYMKSPKSPSHSTADVHLDLSEETMGKHSLFVI